MKIGVLCYPTFGGSGVVATELGKALAEKGHKIHFISYSQPVRLEHFSENVSYHEVLGRTNEDAELIISDPFGTIEFKEPGVFLAAGAGITPFIAIFRDLYKKKKLKGNRLIYSNKTSEDVIAVKELRKMFEEDFINVYTREHTIGFLGRRIDRDFLIEHIGDFGQHFYVCGTDDFVKEIVGHLTSLGASADTIIFEH